MNDFLVYTFTSLLAGIFAGIGMGNFWIGASVTFSLAAIWSIAQGAADMIGKSIKLLQLSNQVDTLKKIAVDQKN